MSDLYVPIDYSNVSEVVPEGDDILYSTFCKVIRTTSGGTAKTKTHAVITQSGIAFCSMTKKKNQSELTFLKWDELKKVRGYMGSTQLLWGRGAYRNVRVGVLRDPEYESKDSFKDRQKKFLTFCKDLWSKKVSTD